MDMYSTAISNAVLDITKRVAIGGLVLGAIIFFTAMANEAQEATRFSPATFKPGEQSLEARFFIPESRKDQEFTIYCGAVVSVRGIIVEQICNWDFDNKPYRIPTENAIKNVRLNPAVVDGRKVVAYIKYSMKIQHKDGESSFKAYPHHFVNSPYYGEDYTAPQSYTLGTDLYATGSTFFGKPWIARRVHRRCSNTARVFLKMKIEKDGQATGVEVIDKPRPKSCGKSIAEAAAEGKYIPAFFKGEPVPAFYVEKYLAE